jgi:hypothetical protein
MASNLAPSGTPIHRGSIDFQGSRVTSDGGLILIRELDEQLGFGDLIDQHLAGPSQGKQTG